MYSVLPTRQQAPQGCVLLSSVLCVRIEAKCLTSPLSKSRIVSTSLAYPANRNWDPHWWEEERHGSKKPAQCWYYWHVKISGDRTGEQPLVKRTSGQHSHQHEHKTDAKKRMCFQSHEPLNHAAHKYLSPHFLFPLFPSILKGWKGTPLTLTVTAVRREIFPHPCNPHNKKGLSCLSDKTGIPWHRGI